ncbi:MAG: BlaI/MecI/CopY family transcriptional regulator [Planctomycetaceae bacterium]|nr:BlaI/MecI/CopY family transcriptional regulator [Planctomycetaceae bacterium]
MKRSPLKLPDAERDVLACLNQLQEATVKELQEALLPLRSMKAASVLTLLKRLEARRLVNRRKADKGKAFIYQPTRKSAGVSRNLVKELFERVFGGDTMSFMAAFLDAQKPSADEIDQMQQLLDDLRDQQSPSERSER